jgi:hypothetical protein
MSLSLDWSSLLSAVRPALLLYLEPGALDATCKSWHQAVGPRRLSLGRDAPVQRRSPRSPALWFLEVLFVSKATFGADTCQQLATLPFLTVIDVRACRGFTDCALAHLGFCRALRDLHVSKCPISEVGLRSLDALRSLRSVSLTKCAKVARWKLPSQLTRFKGPACAVRYSSWTHQSLVDLTLWSVSIDSLLHVRIAERLKRVTLMAHPTYVFPDFRMPSLEYLSLTCGHVWAVALPGASVEVCLYSVLVRNYERVECRHVKTVGCTFAPCDTRLLFS